MPRVALGAVLSVFCLSCAHKGPLGEPMEPAVRYRVDLQAEFETAAPEAPEAVQAALAPLTALSRHFDIVVSLTPVRQYRDDSLGYLVTFDEVTMTGGGTTQVTGLQGRSAELRRFSDGEILNIGLSEHLAGGDRQGEILDVVFPLVSPLPPPLPRQGSVANRAQRWPFSAGRGRLWENRILPDWTWLDTGEQLGRRAWHLGYSGPWAIAGRDVAHEPRVEVVGKGTAKGEVWYSKADADLLAHDFDWVRSLSVTVPGPDAAGLTVQQEQHFTGRVELLPGGVR